jgi:hypothetical protein
MHLNRELKFMSHLNLNFFRSRIFWHLKTAIVDEKCNLWTPTWSGLPKIRRSPVCGQSAQRRCQKVAFKGIFGHLCRPINPRSRKMKIYMCLKI